MCKQDDEWFFCLAAGGDTDYHFVLTVSRCDEPFLHDCLIGIQTKAGRIGASTALALKRHRQSSRTENCMWSMTSENMAKNAGPPLDDLDQLLPMWCTRTGPAWFG